MTEDDLKRITIISDGTGKTAKRLMDAVLAQYAAEQVVLRVENIYQEVRSKQKINGILRQITSEYLVIFSIIEDNLRKYLHSKLHEREILHLDVLQPMLTTMKKFLGFHPHYRPGLLQVIDDKYYSKVDAIGFTVEHDDGRGYNLDQSDLILLGVSRTCKTPISMFMACNLGLKVANIPVIAEEFLGKNLLSRLDGIDRNKIIGLVMQPNVLSMVRMERTYIMTDDDQGRMMVEKYHNEDEIRKEVIFSRRLFERLQIEVIDVTRRAIEEVSAEIIRLTGYDEFNSIL